MKSKEAGAAIVLALAVFFILWMQMNRFTKDDLEVGGLHLSGGRSVEVITLINSSTSTPTLGRYDSLDSPRSTNYTVPTGESLYVYAVGWTNATSTPLTLLFGYGDTKVQNSAAAPTNLVVQYSATGQANGLPMLLTTTIRIPAGKIPVAYIGGTGSYPSDVMAYGVER